jgi:hypothetical protein
LILLEGIHTQIILILILLEFALILLEVLKIGEELKEKGECFDNIKAAAIRAVPTRQRENENENSSNKLKKRKLQ